MPGDEDGPIRTFVRGEAGRCIQVAYTAAYHRIAISTEARRTALELDPPWLLHARLSSLQNILAGVPCSMQTTKVEEVLLQQTINAG